MIKNVLEQLLKNNCKDLVITKELEKKIDNNLLEYINASFNIDNVDDIRSATFFSLGNTYITNKPVILLIDGEYLPNIYTGITEAWFQRKNIIIVALYKEFDRINSEYLRRCVPNIINIYSNNIDKYKNKIENGINSLFPTLINLKYENFSNNKINYSKITNILNKILNKDDEVFVYNADKLENLKFSLINIQEEYKYGILSKYMGYVIAKDKKVILCCTDEIFKYDLNIFNNRYINGNIKILVINLEKFITKENMNNWIESNNIQIFFEEKIDEEKVKKFYNSNKAEIMIIGGEQ